MAGDTRMIDYVYDELGRLIEERYDTELGDGTEFESITRYGYDLASNRIRVEKDLENATGTFTADETIGYVYDPNDRLQTEVKNA